MSTTSRNRIWSKEEEELLIEMWKDRRLSIPEITSIMGRTHASLEAKHKNLDLPSRSELEAVWRIDEIRKRYAEVVDG